MKTGRDIQSLAAEIARQAGTKKDFIAQTDKVEVGVADEKVFVGIGDKGQFPIGDIAHGQIAEHTKIPKSYYDRMKTEAPGLLANNIREWFGKYPAPRMFRTLDSGNRAFLSDRFNTLDNVDFGEAALPMLLERNLDVMSCEITERRLYIKAVDKRLFRDVPVGYRMGDGSHQIFETFAPAIVLANSEVGFGRLVVETGVYTSACTNLALFAKGGMKRTHVGARHKLTEGLDADDLDAIMSDKTKRKTLEALWLQVRDVVASAFDAKVITARVEQIEVAAGRAIGKPAADVIEVTREKFGLNETEGGSILKHLMEGGQFTQYGLSAAITRASQDAVDYDRATELEYLGGRIIELPKTDWSVLAEAA
jgi:hypothetical protein